LWLDCQALADHATPNSKVAHHDLPTNSRLFSLGFDLALFSSERDSFCCFFR
jgi:hypothetical protein